MEIIPQEKCPDCDGKGEIIDIMSERDITSPYGDGVTRYQCKTCKGTGKKKSAA